MEPMNVPVTDFSFQNSNGFTENGGSAAGARPTMTATPPRPSMAKARMSAVELPRATNE